MKAALRKNNSVYQLPLTSNNKFPPAEALTDCSNGWIPSGRDGEGPGDLPSSQSPTFEDLQSARSRPSFGNDQGTSMSRCLLS